MFGIFGFDLELFEVFLNFVIFRILQQKFLLLIYCSVFYYRQKTSPEKFLKTYFFPGNWNFMEIFVLHHIFSIHIYINLTRSAYKPSANMENYFNGFMMFWFNYNKFKRSRTQSLGLYTSSLLNHQLGYFHYVFC